MTNALSLAARVRKPFMAGLLSLASFFPGTALAEPAPAGMIIENQARVSFFNERLGIYESISTNTVMTIVNAVPSLEVEADQTVYLTPNTLGQFAFVVSNDGNTPVAPVLSATQLAGDDFDPENVTIYLDANGNGIVDPGDTPYDGSPVPLDIGEDIGILVTFLTPPSLPDEASASVELIAEDNDEGVSGSAIGTVVISASGLAVEKEVNRATAAAGDVLTYSLTLWNRGTADVQAYDEIEGITLVIDGTQTSGILLRDEIPLNTTFEAFLSYTEPQGFEPLYHVVGASDTEHEYFTEIPAGYTEEDVDAIAFFREGDYPFGFTSEFEFQVRVSPTVSNTIIPNEAETWQSVAGTVAPTPSNPVRTRISGVPAVMVWVDDSDPRNVITSTPLLENVGLILTASACNLDASVAEEVAITITTTPEGDVEYVTGLETGPNTGVFSVTSNIGTLDQIPVLIDNNILSGLRNTVALASTICGGETVTASLVINPGGFVFHSASNAPIEGATVTLYNSLGVGLESVQTDDAGFYIFENPGPGTDYFIIVTPPGGANVVFPSERTLFPGWNRNIHPEASYGDPFDIPDDLNDPFFGIDIPLDPSVSTALILEKDVEADHAAPGDIVTYTLTLTNRLDIAVEYSSIRDQLPAGIRFIEGSARLNGEPATIVTVNEGGLIEFDTGFIPREGVIEITYMAQVEPLASGRLVNVAIAEGTYAGVDTPPNPAISNEARAVVSVSRDRGVFSDRGVILGTVYVDFNQNGIQDRYLTSDGQQALEPGIPGVRIFFENGAHVVTDQDGRYSMPGMTPRMHVAAVSLGTLPETVELHQTRTRDARSPQSRFIRLLPGEIAQEYFAAIPQEGVSRAEVLEELAERAEVFAERAGRIGPQSTLPGGRAPQTVDFIAQNIAAGRETSDETETGILRSQNGPSGAAYDLPESAIAVEQRDIARTRNLEAEIRQMSPALAFLDLRSDDVLNDDVVTIRVKGPAAGTLALLVNGELVPASRISQRVSLPQTGVQALEYVAIRLRGGSNVLTLTLTDPFGNVRETRDITITAPGNSARIEVIAPPEAYADPATPIPVLLRVVDAEGLPTGVSTDITLETQGGGDWGARDIRPSQPGLQVFVDGGEALIDYYPPSVPGTHTIRVRSGTGGGSTTILLEANARERVLVGFIEGVVGIGEEDVDTSNLTGYDETVTGLNGALYLRGRIRGDALLTLRYDSDADSTERLFRDVDPERYYPIYGDASERGFDAQSNSQLYVRIDRGTNYILYGDIDMGPQADGFQLGGYSRSLTGGHVHYEQGPVTIDLMAGRTRQNQVIEEFRALGLSGAYDLDLGDYVEGSERVDVITRDLRQPSTIIETIRLDRYIDYRLDFFNDTILFNTPIQATDEDGNPVFIRVTYESADGQDPYWIYSGEISYDINERLTVGYREIQSDADAIYDDRRIVRAAYAQAEIGEYGRVELEFAQSIDNLGEDGAAGRFVYEFERNDLTLRFHAARTDTSFLGSGSSMASGREEAGVSASWEARPGLSFDTAVLFDRNLENGDERIGAELLAQWDTTPTLGMSGGLRYLDRSPGDGSEGQTVLSGVLGAEWRPDSVEGLVLSGEVEVDLANMDNMRAEVQASQAVTEDLRIYLRSDWASEGAEFLDFSAGAGMTGSLSAGFEYQFTDQILTFAEARSGSQTGFVGGISGEWDVRENLWGRFFPGTDNAMLYASLEHFQPYDVSGLLGLPFGEPAPGESPQTSFAIGSYGEYEDGRGALRLDTEGSIDDTGYTVYARQYWAEGYGDWTWAVENRLAYDHDDTDGNRLRDHLRFGAALRGDEEVVDALFLAGLSYEDDAQTGFDQMIAYWTVGGSWAVNPDTRITFRQAGQYQDLTLAGGQAESFLTLGQVGFEHDFAIREDMDARIGAHASSFYDVRTGETYGGAGIEFGYVPSRNIMISAGYNWSNVEAAEVSEIYHTGAFLRFTLALDDNLWDLFDRAGITMGPGN